MEPTLKSHQLVLVKRTAASIQRDDIIVFRVDETVYIKRVVAVAGDTVQLKDSRVYINHVYLSPYTCDADIAAAYNLEADHYFVLGDNDGASIDSRDFGIISKEHIIGKVILFDAITVGVRIEITLWQARSFGAKRQQAETLTSPRLLLDGAFPIPPVTQISSVAARCAIAIFPRAAAR